VSSTDWPRRCESLTCGSRSTVNIDWSKVNVDRATTGLGWARLRAGLGLPRGELRHCHVAQMDSKQAWVPLDMAHGGHDRAVHGSPVWFTMDLVLLSLLLMVHGAPSAPSRFSAQLLLLPLLGRALTGGERPCLRCSGSKAVLEGSNAPRGHKELNGGVKSAD
jgi:hypothetical protein